MRQLPLREYLPFNYNLSHINESFNKGKFIVEGVIQRAESKNQNGRIYPKPILEREINNYIQHEVAEKRALGELDHPESDVVNLRNVSHNILDIYWKGNDVYGRIEILNTPSGNILKELFRSGITLGISSRGLGSVNQIDESTSEVQPDFQLVCWDFVSNPSTQGAYMYPSNIQESVNLKIDNNINYAHSLVKDIICELSGVCCVD